MTRSMPRAFTTARWGATGPRRGSPGSSAWSWTTSCLEEEVVDLTSYSWVDLWVGLSVWFPPEDLPEVMARLRRYNAAGPQPNDRPPWAG